MSKGTILFKELSMPFDFINTSIYLSSVLVFIPYSNEDMIHLIGNNMSFNVVKNAEGLKGKHLRVGIFLSDIKAIIFDND